MPGAARWHRPDGVAPPDGLTPSLAPRWAIAAVAVAVAVVAVLTPLVWHMRQPNQVDAWAMGWQEVAYGHLLDRYQVYDNLICGTTGPHPTGVVADKGDNLSVRDITFTGNTIQSTACA
jgi:hypothetical protein